MLIFLKNLVNEILKDAIFSDISVFIQIFCIDIDLKFEQKRNKKYAMI